MIRVALLLVVTLLNVSRASGAVPIDPVPGTENSSEKSNPEIFDLAKLRDPFKRLSSGNTAGQALKTELENFPTDQFHMIGIVTGPDKMRALVRAPDGKTHFVRENMKIGVHSGTIKRITPDKIVIVKKMVNVLGEEENVEFELQLPKSGAF